MKFNKVVFLLAAFLVSPKAALAEPPKEQPAAKAETPVDKVIFNLNHGHPTMAKEMITAEVAKSEDSQKIFEWLLKGPTGSITDVSLVDRDLIYTDLLNQGFFDASKADSKERAERLADNRRALVLGALRSQPNLKLFGTDPETQHETQLTMLAAAIKGKGRKPEAFSAFVPEMIEKNVGIEIFKAMKDSGFDFSKGLSADISEKDTLVHKAYKKGTPYSELVRDVALFSAQEGGDDEAIVENTRALLEFLGEIEPKKIELPTLVSAPESAPARGDSVAKQSLDELYKQALRDITELTRQREDYKRQLEESRKEVNGLKAMLNKTFSGRKAKAPEGEPAPASPVVVPIETDSTGEPPTNSAPGK